MTRPGVEIVSRAAPPSSGYPSDTGVWFAVGQADRGRTDGPVLIRNMSEFTKHFGNRVSYSVLYDALEAFFREGGSTAQVLRVVGPAATVDTATLNDAGAAPAIAVDSIGAGATGLSVDVDAVTDGYILRVLLDGVEVERSGTLVTPTDAVNWANKSAYIRVRALGANAPIATGAATDLAGGSDDRAAITDAVRIAALDKLPRTLGPGQVSIPGATTTDAHTGLLEHAEATNRVALLDLPDSADAASLKTGLDADRAATTAEAAQRGAAFGPWIVAPGVVRNTTRTIPPSASVAGLIARSDGLTSNPNVPAAGEAGELQFALGLSQGVFADADRESLNATGANLFREVYGSVRLYGYRPVSTDEAWRSLAAARTRMAIENQAAAIGEKFMFAQLDGKGQKLAEFNGALRGMLAGFYNIGALYGSTADEAFVVDTGSSVNTPETLANDELHAVIGIRTSPFAELVYIEIVKVPITEAL